jgi:tRNA pseudouridine55 synthase
MKKTYRKVNGLVLVDKCAGPTSHAVVSAFKRALSPERIGHLGTLDPFASGLLPIMLGGATRLADDAMEGRKRYLFAVRFGSETDTLDPSGRVVREASVNGVNRASVEASLASFRGAIQQTPPAYSALKVGGRPLYEYMRAEGKLPVDIETKRRTVEIHSFECVDFFHGEDGAPRALLRVICGKGTYVRCLARDLAARLGSAGMCETLRREAVDPWSVDDAAVFRFVDRMDVCAEDVLALLQPPQAMTPHYATVRLPAEPYEKRLLSGNSFVLAGPGLSWEPPLVPLTSEHRFSAPERGFKAPERGLVKAGDTLFLADFLNVDDTVRVQPRKLLDWN